MTIFKFLLSALVGLCVIRAQQEVVILSPRVGTLIDVHENRFYRVFPKIRNFISAQVYSTSYTGYKVRIVVNRKGKQKTYEKKMSMNQFTRFQNKINKQQNLRKKLAQLCMQAWTF